MNVAILVAGTNDPSNADVLADAFIEGLKRIKNMHAKKIRLKDLDVKHFNLKHYGEPSPQPSPLKGRGREGGDDFFQVQNAIEEADGIVIASPVWNFSIPAHLKNMVDRMGAFALDKETHSKGQLKGKPFFFIFTGGAPMIAWKVVMHITTTHLPEAIKYYGGIVAGRYFEPRCMRGRGKFGLVVDQRPKSLETMHRKGERFGHVVEYIEKHGTLPFRYRCHLCVRTWINRIANRMMYTIQPY